MKKILILCCTIFSLCIVHAQFPNVSTGINASGSIALGTQDGNWALVSPSPVVGQAFAVWNGNNHTQNYYSPYWQTTPISGTGAQWVGPTNNIFGNIAGIYTFERPFHIASGTGSF